MDVEVDVLLEDVEAVCDGVLSPSVKSQDWNQGETHRDVDVGAEDIDVDVDVNDEGDLDAGDEVGPFAVSELAELEELGG